jgi:hypothetical protein
MKISKKVILGIASVVLLLVIAHTAQAALVQCGGTANNPKECTIGDLFITVQNVINLLLSMAWLVALVFILWAGWGMVNSGGNEEAITTAKATMSSAIIGFFLVIASFLLINFIISLVGGNSLSYADSLRDSLHIIGL